MIKILFKKIINFSWYYTIDFETNLIIFFKSLLKSYARSRSEYIDEIKDLFEKGLSVFNTLVERISSLKSMLNRHFFFLSYMASIFYNVLYIYLALNLHENQNRILDQYIMQINNDITLRHKIEHINLLLTNQSLASPNTNMPASLSSFNLHTDTQDGFTDDGSVFNESLEKKKRS